MATSSTVEEVPAPTLYTLPYQVSQPPSLLRLAILSTHQPTVQIPGVTFSIRDYSQLSTALQDVLPMELIPYLECTTVEQALEYDNVECLMNLLSHGWEVPRMWTSTLDSVRGTPLYQDYIQALQWRSYSSDLLIVILGSGSNIPHIGPRVTKYLWSIIDWAYTLAQSWSGSGMQPGEYMVTIEFRRLLVSYGVC